MFLYASSHHAEADSIVQECDARDDDSCIGVGSKINEQILSVICSGKKETSINFFLFLLKKLLSNIVGLCTIKEITTSRINYFLCILNKIKSKSIF
jgi:hypothetical protein